MFLLSHCNYHREDKFHQSKQNITEKKRWYNLAEKQNKRGKRLSGFCFLSHQKILKLFVIRLVFLTKLYIEVITH